MSTRGAAVFTTAAPRSCLPGRIGGPALLFAVAMSLAPRPAAAGIDLTWNALNTAGGDSIVTLGCSHPDSVATLYGCFQSPESLERFFGLDILLEIEPEAAELPAYWHLERGGCNGFGAVISAALPDSGHEGAENLWGTKGAAAYSFIDGYGPSPGTSNRARMLCTITRAANNPVKLEAGKNYFAFALQLFPDLAREAGGSCDGCRVPVRIRWISCTLFDAPPRPTAAVPDPVVITTPGRRGTCVGANGASPRDCAEDRAADKDAAGAHGR